MQDLIAGLTIAWMGKLDLSNLNEISQIMKNGVENCTVSHSDVEMFRFVVKTNKLTEL